MKFDRKAITLNVLTLGFTGAKASNQTIKRIKEKRSIPTLSEVAGFLYLVPAFGWFYFVIGFANLLEFSFLQELAQDIEYSIIGTIISTFALFCFLHLILGVALLQHLEEQKSGHRARIIWFGCYGLKWNPIDYLEEDKLEPNTKGNG